MFPEQRPESGVPVSATARSAHRVSDRRHFAGRARPGRRRIGHRFLLLACDRPTRRTAAAHCRPRRRGRLGTSGRGQPTHAHVPGRDSRWGSRSRPASTRLAWRPRFAPWPRSPSQTAPTIRVARDAHHPVGLGSAGPGSGCRMGGRSRTGSVLASGRFRSPQQGNSRFHGLTPRVQCCTLDSSVDPPRTGKQGRLYAFAGQMAAGSVRTDPKPGTAWSLSSSDVGSSTEGNANETPIHPGG